MYFSLWDYLRRRAADAVLAGFKDALDFIEPQDQPQLVFTAARQLKQRLTQKDDASSAPQPATTPSPATAPATSDALSTASPAAANKPAVPTPAPAPAPADRPASAAPPQGHRSTSLPFPPPRRGRGRPRKETHG